VLGGQQRPQQPAEDRVVVAEGQAQHGPATLTAGVAARRGAPADL
jgi:hypothetical protein